MQTSNLVEISSTYGRILQGHSSKVCPALATRSSQQKCVLCSDCWDDGPYRVRHRGRRLSSSYLCTELSLCEAANFNDC